MGGGVSESKSVKKHELPVRRELDPSLDGGFDPQGAGWEEADDLFEKDRIQEIGTIGLLETEGLPASEPGHLTAE